MGSCYSLETFTTGRQGYLPKADAFARKTKLALNPDKIPDLGWQRATNFNTPTT